MTTFVEVLDCYTQKSLDEYWKEQVKECQRRSIEEKANASPKELSPREKMLQAAEARLAKSKPRTKQKRLSNLSAGLNDFRAWD